MRQLRFAILNLPSKALAVAMLAGSGLPIAADAGEPAEPKLDRPKAARDAVAAQADSLQWKETPAIETPGWLPGSVAHSADGKTIVVGGADGHVIAFDAATRQTKWKTSHGGGFAAVAYTADQNSVLATFKDGVRLLDADTGKIENSFQEPDSHPTAVAAFPDEVFPVNDQRLIKNHKIIFGSAILTGPVHRDTGKNVLWAWVAGNYEKGSPGNRVMEGHEAVVVSAAWSKDGKLAVTGDVDGRVIVWDATAIQETERRELGGRVAALAISPDGQEIAAVVVGKQAEFCLWKAGQTKPDMQSIHIDRSDVSGPIHASLSFAPNGNVLAGSAVNLESQLRLGELIGNVHFWERKQVPPAGW